MIIVKVTNVGYLGNTQCPHLPLRRPKRYLKQKYGTELYFCGNKTKSVTVARLCEIIYEQMYV